MIDYCLLPWQLELSQADGQLVGLAAALAQPLTQYRDDKQGDYLLKPASDRGAWVMPSGIQVVNFSELSWGFRIPQNSGFAQ